MKKIFFISKSVSDFLYADKDAHNLYIINMGVGMFNRNQSRWGGSASECIFRVDQDGVTNLVPYMTKRLVWAQSEQGFK